MRNEAVHIPHYFRGIKEIEKQLDSTNTRILRAMWKFGPRNLLEVARRTGIPFTTVYHRAAKLEEKSKRIVYLIPQTSKLGLVRAIVLVAAKAGTEELVTQGLKIPNLWRFTNICEGTFTHLSAHAVPINSLKNFKKYIQQLSKMGLITQFRIILTGDSIPNFPDFGYYDPHQRRWSFKWAQWITALKKKRPNMTVQDPREYPLLVDKKDVLIVKELQRNGRRTFADLEPMLGISQPAIKYRYDRLVSLGVIRYFAFDVYPYPVEISAFHEVMLQFTSNNAMSKFHSFVHELFFVLGVAKVLRQNTLIVRTYIPQSQLPNMFAFFSELAKAGMVASYSSVRLAFAGRQAQTISYELFHDEKGWEFNLEHALSNLSKMATLRKAPVARTYNRTSAKTASNW